MVLGRRAQAPAMRVLADPEHREEARREDHAGDRRDLLGQQVRRSPRRPAPGRSASSPPARRTARPGCSAAPRTRGGSGRLNRSTSIDSDMKTKLQTTPKAYASPSVSTSPRLATIVTIWRMHDQVDQPRGRAVPGVRLEEPVGQHAVLGDAVEHAVGADDRRVDGAREDQEADAHDQRVEDQPRPLRARRRSSPGRRSGCRCTATSARRRG